MLERVCVWRYMCQDAQSSIHITNDQRAYRKNFALRMGILTRHKLTAPTAWATAAFHSSGTALVNFRMLTPVMTEHKLSSILISSNSKVTCDIFASCQLTCVSLNLDCDTLKTRRDGGGHFSSPAAPASSWHAFIYHSRNLKEQIARMLISILVSFDKSDGDMKWFYCWL
jgi:hypothetical protein